MYTIVEGVRLPAPFKLSVESFAVFYDACTTKAPEPSEKVRAIMDRFGKREGDGGSDGIGDGGSVI